MVWQMFATRCQRCKNPFRFYCGGWYEGVSAVECRLVRGRTQATVSLLAPR
ncbi:hypothetical protein Pla111_22170 [Botrimarina hoheduenensis]|uniref:Uncharacterized protein n=1 Tax=Botrimarina hoheduenensis TaxID=2528000 RepID=A0A5C5VYS6_9BACT|nr:hypothetical protein Pla111_22170 [Botrimarina hoheduenensis]